MRFVYASRFDVPVGSLFGFHERADALSLLMPPWEKARVIVPPASLDVGTVVVVQLRVGPVPVEVRAEHVAYRRGVEFADRLHAPPFREWLHRHRFAAEGSGSILVDDITWSLGFAPLDRWAERLVIGPRLRRMFAYRHEATARALGAGPPQPLRPDEADARLPPSN